MTLYTGLDLLDGDGLRADTSLRIEHGTVTQIGGAPDADAIDLSENGQRALICPGFIDLQVNGGGGLMLGDCQSIADIARLVQAHRAGGTTALLPTLISDTPETTARIIDLMAEAARALPGVLGLHLEGPHLAVAGAHDPNVLRPMTEADLALYLDAASRLPHLMITLAPEQVSWAQIRALSEAGVLLSLGHTACTYEAARRAFEAGAKGATHLFNAMSGLHHRAPGLVGAALDHATHIGLISDAVHVHPSALRIAVKSRPDALYLISDAMAVAGTDSDRFQLGGREILRRNGRLTLADGTLAGADLTLARAVKLIRFLAGMDLADVLRLGFDAPHRALTGRARRISEGQSADLLHYNGNDLRAIHDADGWHIL